MESFEKRLAEEVRKYRHLYDASNYKDLQTSINSWREISATLGQDETVCRAKWKYLRDRFVKAERKMKSRGVGPPRIYRMLSWLDGCVSHRETGTKAPNEDSTAGSSPSAPAYIILDVDSAFAPISPSPTPPSSPAPPSPPDLLQAPLSDSSVGSPKAAVSPPAVSPVGFPETGAPSSRRKRKDTSKTDDAIKKRLEDVDRRREERALKQDAEEVRFASTVADMLRRLPQSMRSVAQFKVHELLFNMEQEYLRSLKQSSGSEKRLIVKMST